MTLITLLFLFCAFCGVTSNSENELELLFSGWVDFINLINFYFEICDII